MLVPAVREKLTGVMGCNGTNLGCGLVDAIAIVEEWCNVAVRGLVGSQSQLLRSQAVRQAVVPARIRSHRLEAACALDVVAAFEPFD